MAKKTKTTVVTGSRTQKLYNALNNGRSFTTEQIMSQFGFSTPNSVSAVISHMQRDRGVVILAEKTRQGVNRYSIG